MLTCNKTVMSDMIIGTCDAMCPGSERRLREREGLLSVLEMDDTTKHFKYPKADKAKVVKSYKNSSPGTSMMNPNELRPGPVLLLTIKYLFTKVLVRKDVKWTTIYEFVFDRTKAIRQDMIIQRLDVSISIKILEPIVRFHIYAAERMREKSPKEYVSKFNDDHLRECITQLLVMYDKRDSEIMAENSGDLCNRFQGITIDDNRTKIEALYLLLYLGISKALVRGLSLPVKYRESACVKQALTISLAWYTRNYVRVCREIPQLSPLLAMAALDNLRSIRRNSLQIMSAAYSSKNLTFPGRKVKEILLYSDIAKVAEDCKLFHLDFTADNIHFKRLQFNTHEALACPEKRFSDRELIGFLPDILFE